MASKGEYHFFPFDRKKVIQEIGKDELLAQLKKMLLIRHFEIRGEAADIRQHYRRICGIRIGDCAVSIGGPADEAPAFDRCRGDRDVREIVNRV